VGVAGSGGVSLGGGGGRVMLLRSEYREAVRVPRCWVFKRWGCGLELAGCRV